MLSFSEFEGLYESYGLNTAEGYQNLMLMEAEIPPATPAKALAVPTKTADAEKKETVEDIFAIFKKLDNKAEGNQSISEETPAGTTKAPVNEFKLIRFGEESGRVKILQKSLGIKETGEFDKATLTAVKKFQKDNGLRVDGLVGPQTYTKILEIIQKITDKAKIDEEIAKIVNLSINLIEDPRYYGIFESTTIVTINNKTYIICVPAKDASQKVEGLKKEGAIGSGFEWIEQAGQAVGKAIAYTLLGPVVLTMAVAKGIISAGHTVMNYVAEGAANVFSSVVHGLGQVASWVLHAPQVAWNTVKATGEALFSGFCTLAATAVKGVQKAGEALVAVASAIGTGIKSAVGATAELVKKAGQVAWGAIKTVGQGVIKAWQGLAAAEKAGMDALKSAVKTGVTYLANTAKTVYNGAKTVVKAVGNAITSTAKAAYNVSKTMIQGAANVVKTIAKGAVTVVAGGVKFVGNVIQGIGQGISDVGDWMGSLFEELFAETGDKLWEELAFETAQDFKVLAEESLNGYED
jgi:peptidoglycan hydrolase-like protein with peptidoglycan-binding domain